MDWKFIETEDQLEAAFKESWEKPIAIFKHSKRCSISMMALSRVERKWNFPQQTIQPYFIDLWTYRSLSDEIARRTGIRHESPQLIVLHIGKVLYEASHHIIDVEQVKTVVAS